MKIALAHSFVGGRAGGGGGVRQMLELGRALKQQGHEVVICAQQFEPGSIEPDPQAEFEVRAVNTGEIAVPHSRLSYLRLSWMQTKSLAKLIPKDADAINLHEAPAHFTALHLPQSSAPIVWTRNDATLYEMALMPEEVWAPTGNAAMRGFRRQLGRPDRRAAARMEAIGVLDQRNRRMVERAYGRSAEVIQSGAAEKFFIGPSKIDARAQLGIPDDEFAVLCVGISAPYRRHEDLIDATALLGRRRPEMNVRARIVGSDHIFPDVGSMLREKVARLPDPTRVELMQQAISDDDLTTHLAAADAFVFPNELQTWGLAPLEAIAAGTPVVVSRGAGVHEVLEGRAGVELVSPRAPDQIAAAIAAVADDPAGYDVSETRSWIRENFSAATYANRMAALMTRGAQRS